MLTSKERTCKPCSLAYNCCRPSLWLAEVLGLSNRASLGGGNFTSRDYELSTVVSLSNLRSSCVLRLAKYGRRGDEDPPTALGSFLGPGEHATQNQRLCEPPGFWLVFQDMSAFSCGDTTSASQFYFVSPAYPVSDS